MLSFVKYFFPAFLIIRSSFCPVFQSCPPKLFGFFLLPCGAISAATSTYLRWVGIGHLHLLLWFWNILLLLFVVSLLLLLLLFALTILWSLQMSILVMIFFFFFFYRWYFFSCCEYNLFDFSLPFFPLKTSSLWFTILGCEFKLHISSLISVSSL